MPAICTGPQRSDGCSPSSSSNSKSPIRTAVDTFRNFITDLTDKSSHSKVPQNSPRAIKAEARRVKVAQDYMSARLAGRNEDVLGLVTEDVELVSSRDGKVVGKSQFREYISRVKPTGAWHPATWNSAIGKAEILGNVKILMVNFGVIAHFGFDRTGKINEIYVGTRRKAAQQ